MVSTLVLDWLFRLWSYIRCSDSGLILLVLTSVSLSFMLSNNRRSDRDSSEQHSVCRGDVSIEPLRHIHSASAGDAGVVDASGSAPFSSRAPPSGSSVVAMVHVTNYIDSFRLFKETWSLAEMNQDGNRVVFVGARFRGTHDTGL